MKSRTNGGMVIFMNRIIINDAKYVRHLEFTMSTVTALLF